MATIDLDGVYSSEYGWYSSVPGSVSSDGYSGGLVLYRFQVPASSVITAVTCNVSWYTSFSTKYNNLTYDIEACLYDIDEENSFQDISGLVSPFELHVNTPGETNGVIHIAFSNLNIALSNGHSLGIGIVLPTLYGGLDIVSLDTPSNANFTYTLPPTISTHPKSKTVGEGQTVSFSVTASGNVSYQWEKYNESLRYWESITGATSSNYSVTTSYSDNGSQYRCYVYNIAGSATSDPATLTVTEHINAPTIITDPSNVATYIGYEVTFSVSASDIGNLSYQWKYSTNGDSWYSISGATSDSYTISSATSSMNGRYFRCSVTNEGGTTDSGYALLTVYPKPSITTQPSSAEVIVGQTASFSIVATGHEISYQWQYSTDSGSTWIDTDGDSPIVLDEGEPEISFTATSEMNNRRYRCVVTNNSGSTISSTVRLSVYDIANITRQPTNQTVVEGNTVTFYVTASGRSLIYEWLYSTDGITWTSIPDSNSPSYSFIATSDKDGRLYSCAISNPAGFVESEAATLTVLPELTLTPSTSSVTAGTAVAYTIGNRHNEIVTVRCYYGGIIIKTISNLNAESFSVSFENDLCKRYGSNQIPIDVIVTAPSNRQVSASLTVNEDTTIPPTVTVVDFHPVKMSGESDSTFTDWIKDYSRAYFKVSVTTSGSSSVAEDGVVLSYPGGTNVVATQQNSSNYYALTAEPLSAAPVTLTMTVTDTNGNTTSVTRTVNVLEDGRPIIGEVLITPVSSTNPADIPNAWIAGRTKAFCAVSVTSPFGTTIRNVALSFPNGTTVNAHYNSTSDKWEATTAEPVPGNVTVTITATDANSSQKTKDVSITGVVTYTEPYVTLNTPVRCDEYGQTKSGGDNCKLTVTQHYCSALSGNSIEKLTACVKDKTAIDVISGASTIIPGLDIPTAAYVIEVTIQDKVSSEIKKYLVVEGQSVNTNPNMVICNGETYIDLTEDTVSHSKLKFGKIAIDKSGSMILGTVITRTANEIKVANGNVYIPAGFYGSDITIETT